MKPDRLSAESLYSACDPAQFTFKSTDELEPLEGIIGQDRAVEAVQFAIGMKRDGYNLFAFGPQGVGKSNLVHKFLTENSLTLPVPDDWCYVHNFADPHKPRAVRLPAGRGRPFATDVEKFVEDLQAAIPAQFESDEYRTRRQSIEDDAREKHEEGLIALQDEARKGDVAIVRTPMGFAVTPTKDGEMLKPDDFQKLPEAEQNRLTEAMEDVQNRLEEILREAPKWEKEHREKVRELNREVTESVVRHLIGDLFERYRDVPDAFTFLGDVRDDVITNARDFLPEEQGPGAAAFAIPQRMMGTPPLVRYQVNVVVDNSGRDVSAHETEAAPDIDVPAAAPVIDEDNPTLPNLIGRVEHRSEMGTLITDFTMIKAGSLHQANGGYLVLDARKLLTQPFAWDALKRALQTRQIKIESPASSFGLIDTITLTPEPIPLDVKIVLLGDPELYYLLMHYEPDFQKLFKVGADFDTLMDRNDTGAMQYARLMRTITQKEDMKPLNAGAVARVVEHGARLADDAEKLSTHVTSIVDLLGEADYWAEQENRKTISAAHIQKAIDANIRRSDRLRERVQEQIVRETVVIDTAGERIGEVNGLAVYQLDHFSFGKPSRISCRVRMGRGEIIDIERQVELGGPLHSKGVLILSSFLSGRYTKDLPLALSASLVFEQSYGGVDGDSASAAELFTLLSAISEIPIKQCFAVTGSVDQYGRVQAIGGVNQKIEGFFDLCAARGLTGDQGVLIPASNIKHLMLRADVVEAVRKNQFSVYGIKTIDEGIEMLTGVPAGEIDTDGEYPIGSVNRAVAARLRDMAKTALKLGSQKPDNGRSKEAA